MDVRGVSFSLKSCLIPPSLYVRGLVLNGWVPGEADYP